MPLPAWASKMRDLFRSGSVAQFLLHGNVFDVIPHGDRQLSLKAFLDEAMFGAYDTVLHYDRSRGVRATRGADDWGAWLQQALGDANPISSTREPGVALELIDRYLLRTLNLAAIQRGSDAAGGGAANAARKVAVIVDFAEFVVPRADAAQLGGPFAANVVKVLGWANDPAILQANVITVLIAEGLHDLNALVSENPHAAEIKLPLPDEAEMAAYVDSLAAGPIADLAQRSDLPLATLGQRLTGLSRVGARRLVTMATRSGQRLTADWVSKVKKDLIESECQGLLDFIESKLTLDDMAGSEPVKAWLREDQKLLEKGALHALPMGYLVAGRIGTGKTYLVQCWAGELGIPVRRLQELPGSLGRRHRIEPREDLFRPESYRTGAGLRRRSRPGRRQARGRRHGRGPLRPRLRDAREGDVGHAQPRSDSLGLRHVTARPPRGRPQAPGPSRRPHPALRAGDARRDAGAVPGHRPQAEVPAQGRRPAGARPVSGPRQQRDRGRAGARPPRVGAGARARSRRCATSWPACSAKCGRARTPASSNTWTSWRSRSAPISASCRRGSAT